MKVSSFFKNVARKTANYTTTKSGVDSSRTSAAAYTDTMASRYDMSVNGAATRAAVSAHQAALAMPSARTAQAARQAAGQVPKARKAGTASTEQRTAGQAVNVRKAGTAVHGYSAWAASTERPTATASLANIAKPQTLRGRLKDFFGLRNS